MCYLGAPIGSATMLANREFELKLALSEDDFKRLIAHPRLSDPQLERSEKVLKSIYYDTPDLRLRDLGRHAAGPQ